MKPSIAPLVLACLVGVGVFASAARAERADRQRPIQVEADRMSADDLQHVATFNGRVVVIQGTFLMCADQVTLRQDKDGNQTARSSGSPATFREKRDGVDEWIEGEAERIEYDTRTETLELFNRARVLRGRDEVRGNFIIYDARTEIVRVQDGKDAGAPTSREGRVSAIFQPRTKAGEGQPRTSTSTGGPLALQPATESGPPPSATGSTRPATCRPGNPR